MWCAYLVWYMSGDNFMRANEVDVNVTGESNLPEGWEQTHEEGRRPIRDGMGYYIHQYQSEHFLVSQDTDMRDGETVHHVALLKVKRGDDGEMLTSAGTGIYRVIGVEDGKQAFPGESYKASEDAQFDVNEQAHEAAEQAAFQVAVNLMREVNAGKHREKRYSD